MQHQISYSIGALCKKKKSVAKKTILSNSFKGLWFERSSSFDSQMQNEAISVFVPIVTEITSKFNPRIVQLSKYSIKFTK